jgi:Nucleotidyl transferase AbiEii toxin, Type IV TA system
MSHDIQASIKARLLNKVKETGDEFELFLVRYACERFLYRVGASTMRERCILKGAGLLTLWMNDPYRSTRDVDLLAIGSSDAANIMNIMKVICSVPCYEDGLAFDLGSLEISPIREEAEYQGQRAVLNAYLGKAKIRVQIDFGFGDAVSPGPEEAEYPTIIKDLPAPQLRIYPKVVTITEKFEAMVKLGRQNSRMKDFHDIWALSSTFSFNGAQLREAILNCFERRKTPWTLEVPDPLTQTFYTHDKLHGFWNSYLRSGAFGTPPPADFETIGEQVREFLGPVRDCIIDKYPFDMHWPAVGPWMVTE